jgi:hypothetical protein
VATKKEPLCTENITKLRNINPSIFTVGAFAACLRFSEVDRTTLPSQQKNFYLPFLPNFLVRCSNAPRSSHDMGLLTQTP